MICAPSFFSSPAQAGPCPDSRTGRQNMKQRVRKSEHDPACSLCIAGGGTGGHVFPALALADIVRRHWPHLQVSFIGAERGLESELLPARGEQALFLTIHSIQGAGFMQRLRVFAWELPRAILRIWSDWRAVRPRLLVGVGGYASAAGVVAAILYRIPVVLYEQNAVPGLVNRKLARFCKGILVGFTEAAEGLPQRKCVHIGNLVPPAIRHIRWQPHVPPRLIVLGGSQGAQFLNETVPPACRLLKCAGYSFTVTHVAGDGSGRKPMLARAYRDAGIDAEVLGFCRDMPGLYVKGDLMLTRAGAMSVAEAAVVGMPAIFVPLPHAANDHQYYNARTLVSRGAAIIIDQKTGDAKILASEIEHILFDAKRLKSMSEAAVKSVPERGEEKLLGMLGTWLGQC